jgi:hypothetical protein
MEWLLLIAVYFALALLVGRFLTGSSDDMRYDPTFSQYNKVYGSVPEGLDSTGIDLEGLFQRPSPEGWNPEVKQQVYLRPGVTIGGVRAQRATVLGHARDVVLVEVQVGRKRKQRAVPLEDVRPI